MKIAFYAPMNAPDEGPPSGDRLIAQQVIEGLEKLGHEVEIATRLKTWSKDPEALEELKTQASTEVARLHGADFDAWLTYHVYYKAPDLIGPWIARARGIPYYIVEGSLAPRRAEGPWAEHYALTEEALNVAERIFCISPRDHPALQEAGFAPKLADLDPFIDARAWTRPRKEQAGGPLRLVTTAMMREGDKLESYQLIAAALVKLDMDWQLTIHGDGPAREKVEKAFTRLKEKVTFAGLTDPFALAEAYANADIFVWPGIGEGLGINYLEAQAAGLPVIACNGPGPQGALDDLTARLTQKTPDAYAWAIRDLGGSAARRETMSKAARRRASTKFSRERFLMALRAGIGGG